MSLLQVFKDILFTNLAPWHNHNTPEVKFRQLISELPELSYTAQPKYEVVFQTPVPAFRQYYHKLIRNGAIEYINWFHADMAIALSDDERYYLVRAALTQNITQRLTDTARALQLRDPSSPEYKPELSTGRTSAQAVSELYVLDYAKSQLIRLYLEVQDAFPEYVKEQSFTAEDLLSHYFGEELTKPFITDAPALDIPLPIRKTSTPVRKKTAFTPNLSDFRGEVDGLPPFDIFVKNKEAFARTEEALFTKGLIDADYNFLDTQGNQRLLAAVYYTMWDKKLFNDSYYRKANVEKGKRLVREFLNSRYGARVEKEYRNFFAPNQQKASQKYLTQHAGFLATIGV